MGEAVNEGARIHYEIVGKGEPLILHHGSPDEAATGVGLAMSSPLASAIASS